MVHTEAHFLEEYPGGTYYGLPEFDFDFGFGTGAGKDWNWEQLNFMQETEWVPGDEAGTWVPAPEPINWTIPAVLAGLVLIGGTR